MNGEPILGIDGGSRGKPFLTALQRCVTIAAGIVGTAPRWQCSSGGFAPAITRRISI